MKTLSLWNETKRSRNPLALLFETHAIANSLGLTATSAWLRYIDSPSLPLPYHQGTAVVPCPTRCGSDPGAVSLAFVCRDVVMCLHRLMLVCVDVDVCVCGCVRGCAWMCVD